MKSKIVISLPLVWSYRNFVVNGLCKSLAENFTVFYAVPAVAVPAMLKQGVPEQNIILLQSKNTTGFEAWTYRILKKSFAKRFPVNTTNIFKKLGKKISARSILKEWAVYSLPASFFTSNSMFSLLEKMENYLYLRKFNDLKASLEKIKPDYVLSTTNVVPNEWPLFRASQALGIKTYSHILSFDNLTSRGYMPIGKFDSYFVWNSHMAGELTKYYGIDPSKIKITGTPQFDYHIDPKYLLSRKQTLNRLGFSEDDEYILYCANHFNISPCEPELVDVILQSFLHNSELAGYKIVLRLHPMDKYERWNSLVEKYPGMHLSLPWPHTDKEAIYWGEPTLQDLELFSNTLRYSSVMLNIASTVSIDAAITNTPIVCVGFHPSKKQEGEFYRNVHFSEHYAPIMETGATPLATSQEELTTKICEQLSTPEKFERHRKMLRNRFLPETINSSTETIIDLLNNVVDKGN